MPTIRISPFGGVQPRTSSRLLPDNASARAENVKLQSGELRPLNKPRLVYIPHKALPPKTIYRARNKTSEGWLTWPHDVDVVRAPLAASAESRYCWTGDGEPRMAKHSQAISGANDDYPKAFYALGIPRPIGKPAVSATGGSLTTVTRFYCCTFYSANGEESANSRLSDSVSGKTDGSWTITGLSEFPQNTGTGTATHADSVTTFTNAGAVPHWLRVGDIVVINGARLEVIEANEATPAVFKVPGNYAGATSWAREAPWNTAGMTRRLYRTTGTSGSWQLVALDVGTSYIDTLTDSQILGDELISEGWLPPPAGLKGLCVHSSGALAGFVENTLYLSEPMQPHAWKAENSRTADYPVIGLAPFGSSIAVATSGNPYVASGVEPESMSMEKIDGLYPCVSKRSVVSVGDGALYASNHGLLMVGQGGVSVFTDSWYTRDEWYAMNPSSMVCEYTNGRVYCAYETAAQESEILIFDTGVHTVVGIAASDLYADQATGALYLGTPEGIVLFDPETFSYPMGLFWRSKEFLFATPCNLGAAKVDFKVAIDPAVLVQLIAEREAQSAKNAVLLANGGFFGAMNFKGYNRRAVNGSEAYYVPPLPPSNDVQFVLRNDDKVIFSKTIKDTKAFRLPAGVKYDHCSVEVSGQGVIYSIVMAETMDALRQA